MIFEKVKTLNHIGLLDERRAEDAVPAPVLHYRTLTFGNVVGRSERFVKKSILLKKYTKFFVFGEIHVFDDVFPAENLIARKCYFLCEVFKSMKIAFLHLFDAFYCILQTPNGNVVCKPVVVYIVFVHVWPCHSEDHIFFLFCRNTHPLTPEAGNGNKNAQSVIGKVVFVACVSNVIVYSISYYSVAMNFFESHFPFVVALYAIEGGYRKKGSSIGETQFFGIQNGFRKMPEAVKQEVF